MGSALRKACDADYDDEAICLARAAKIVRRDMLKLQSIFTGTFDKDCQVKSVPHSLLALVSMIHNGPSIKSQGVDGLSQATLSVAQLLQYNSFVRQRPEITGVHHNKARETPLPMYIGLTIHARTRKRDTVSSFGTKGKKTAWTTWINYEDITPTFLALSAGPAHIKDEDVAMLERFTILLYNRTSTIVKIDEARQELFTKKGRAMDALPPTKAALVQHIKRAVYQGGHCWGKTLQVCLDMPTPRNWAPSVGVKHWQSNGLAWAK